MFNQLRQVVENVTTSDTNPPEQARDQMSRSNSLDSRLPASLSSSQLAESALSNLRKSLATQRSNSVSNPTKPAATTENRIKSRLEERLRAATTNALSAPTRTSSPGPASATTTQSPSPQSVPLPDSPISSPKLESVESPSAPAVKVNSPAEPVLLSDEAASEALDRPQEVELPPAVLNEIEDAQPGPSPDSLPPPAPTVDELHEKLKQLEQRFSGQLFHVCISVTTTQVIISRCFHVLQKVAVRKGCCGLSPSRILFYTGCT
jgi:hypothetical protein